MNLPVLICTQSLFNILNNPTKDHSDLLIIDLCSAENYAQGHLKGAVNFPPSKLYVGTQPAPGMLPPLAELKASFEAMGLTPDKQVLVYDDAGGSWAGRMIWTLDLIGHMKSSLLDGGIVAWRKEALPVTQEIPKIEPSVLSLALNMDLIADKEEIVKHLKDPNYVIWDARAPEEYSGAKKVSARGGHIPNAVNVEWTQLTDAQNYTRILPVETLQSILNEKGISSDKNIVTHCQTHRRSGLTYFVAAKLLGYQHIKAYPGSWAEWGNSAELPIETSV